MKKYEDLINMILKYIGGKENIIDITHCVTRLRFHLVDENKADDAQLKKVDGVITVMHSAGQYQVVVGNEVPYVYEELCAILNLEKNNPCEHGTKMTFKDTCIDYITAIFMPSIAVLCACGMIKGLNSILNFIGVYTMESGIYTLVNAIGDSFFYFFPIVIGYNSAKKFGLNSYLGMMIGAALCYPAINGIDLEIFGIAMNVTYTSTILPVIITVAIAAPMERYFNKVLPTVIKSFLTPMIVMLVATMLGFIIIGPIANSISNIVSDCLLNIYSVSPLLSGILVGGLWQVLVVFGVHMTLVILAIVNIANGVPDPILSLSVFVAFAQSATVLAIMLKTKNKKLKSICFPAFISGMFGVTEPAIYGITLPRIKMFLISCLGGAISGGFAGLVGLKYYTMAGLGIFELPALFPKEGVGTVLVQSVIALVIAFAVSFILSYIFYKDEKTDEIELVEHDLVQNNEVVYAPMNGDIKQLKDVQDDAFAQEALGKGIAIIPSDGNVCAPFDGTIMTLFPTKHAIGIVSDSGCEVLIHIGMNTVQLEGKHFTTLVKQGDKVKKGQLMVSFEREQLLEKGYCIDTCVIVTNSNDYLDILDENKASIGCGDTLLIALR